MYLPTTLFISLSNRGQAISQKDNSIQAITAIGAHIVFCRRELFVDFGVVEALSRCERAGWSDGR